MRTTIQLTEEESNRTRVKLTWEEDGNWTAEERETFANARGGMTAGWTGSLDKLDEYLLTR